MSPARKTIEFLKDSVRQTIRREIVMLRDQLANTIVAKEFSGGILRIADSVRVKHDHITGVENEAALIVSCFLENSERKTDQPNLFATAPMKQERLLLPRICNSQFAPSAMPGCKTERHESPLDHALAQKAIDGPQHFRGPVLLGRETAKCSDAHGAVKCSRTSLPTHVSQRDRQFLRPITQKIVKIAAQFARRHNPGRNIEPIFGPGKTRQHRALNPASGCKIPLHPRFIARHLLVEARVFKRNRKLRRKNRKHLHVVRREIIQLRAFEIHHTDNAILIQHRHGKLRARLRIHHQIPRVERNVRNHHGPPQRGRRSDDSLMRRHSVLFLNALPEFHRHAMTENVLSFLVQQDAENLVINQAFRELGSAAQHFLHAQS